MIHDVNGVSAVNCLLAVLSVVYWDVTPTGESWSAETSADKRKSDERSHAEILVGTNQTFSIYPNQGPCRLLFSLPEDGCDAC